MARYYGKNYQLSCVYVWNEELKRWDYLSPTSVHCEQVDEYIEEIEEIVEKLFLDGENT